jgi:hypothetical protein
MSIGISCKSCKKEFNENQIVHECITCKINGKNMGFCDDCFSDHCCLNTYSVTILSDINSSVKKKEYEYKCILCNIKIMGENIEKLEFLMNQHMKKHIILEKWNNARFYRDNKMLEAIIGN